MADGCPGLIFQHADQGSFIQNGKKLSEAFLFGQTTRYAEIKLAGSFKTVGVYFQPHALQTVFGYKPDELTDSCLDVNLMAKKHGFNLSEQLSNAATSADQLDILSAYLQAQVDKNTKQDNEAMQYALVSIIQSNGTVSLNQLQKYLQLSERSFQRNFKLYTGITPKLFSRICRFQASLKQLKDISYDKLSDIAYGHDYADQSHFIRSFKEFSGLSPNQYLKQTNELVENFAEVLK